MSYSDFSLSKVKRDFNLTTVENGRFLPLTQSIEPSDYLKEALSEGLPLATATGSEKVRSGLSRSASGNIIGNVGLDGTGRLDIFIF